MKFGSKIVVINLPLKINFGSWIKNQEQSGRWIAILPLESHLDRRINTGVIWAVRSRCMKEGKYHQKINDISPIYFRYIADISPIFCHQRQFFQKISDISLRANISSIFQRYLQKYLPSDFSPRNIVSTPLDTRSIDDISPIYPDIFLLGQQIFFNFIKFHQTKSDVFNKNLCERTTQVVGSSSMFELSKYLDIDYVAFLIDGCQEFEANPTYDNHPRGGVNRVMVSFSNLN